MKTSGIILFDLFFASAQLLFQLVFAAANIENIIVRNFPVGTDRSME
jgi:hypothetical protein